jgi:hypothetical protein
MTDRPTGDPGRSRAVDAAASYDIRVLGHLAPRWAARFEGMSLTAHDDGSTVIHGPVADQAALHGLLRTLSDLGLPLISVAPAPAAAPVTSRRGRTP